MADLHIESRDFTHRERSVFHRFTSRLVFISNRTAPSHATPTVEGNVFCFARFGRVRVGDQSVLSSRCVCACVRACACPCACLSRDTFLVLPGCVTCLLSDNAGCEHVLQGGGGEVGGVPLDRLPRVPATARRDGQRRPRRVAGRQRQYLPQQQLTGA